MGKRLNPKRRREMVAKLILLEEKRKANPSVYQEEVSIRSAGLPTALWGSSKGLAKGYCHSEADMIVYAQHKRRKPTGKGVSVDPAKVQVTQPAAIPDPTPRPSPVPVRKVSRPLRVVPKSKKLWSAT